MGCVPALGGGCATLGFGICMSGDVFLTGAYGTGDMYTRPEREAARTRVTALSLNYSPDAAGESE